MKVMKQATRRGIALFIALMISLSAMQLTAFAAEEDGQPVPDAGTVTDVAEAEPAEAPEDAETPEESQQPEETGDPAEAEEPEEPTEAEEPAEETTEGEEPSDAEQAEEEEVVEEDPAEELTNAIVPEITGLKIEADGKVNYPVPLENGFYVAVPGTTLLADCKLTLTTYPAVDFQKQEDIPAGSLYVSGTGDNSVSLNFNITVNVAGQEIDLNDSFATITLDTTDHEEWIGRPSGIAQVSLSSLASSISRYKSIDFAANSMVARNTANGSAAYKLSANQCGNDVYLIFYPADVPTYTVKYVSQGSTNTWTVPAGMPLDTPIPTLASGQTFLGWCTDADGKEPIAEKTPASEDVTLYASIKSEISTDSDFAKEFARGDRVLHIGNINDWNSFAACASEISNDRLVVLTDNLTLGDGNYTAIPFTGNFDGNNFKISGGTFDPLGDNGGIFATFGSGQIIANVVLDNITVSGGTYAGALVGSCSASHGNRSRIQNVQVQNCKISGRTAGGIAGNIFLSDVEFCSSRSTRISGLANAGGIVGISYGNVTNCFSVNDTLLSLKAGGIVASNLEACNVQHCWTTSGKVIAYEGIDSKYSDVLAGVNSRTQTSAFTGINLDAQYWNILSGTRTNFIQNSITYPFTEYSTQNW